MTDLSTLNAKTVIMEGNLAEYQRGMKFFHAQLLHLNITIHIIEKILELPFDLFVPPDKTIFFRAVVRNFFDSGVLAITKLETDQGNDFYTLKRFKKRVRELIRPEFSKEFDARLKKHSFNARTKTLFDRAKALRDGRIAHTKPEFSKGMQLKFTELKVLRDALCSLLDDLSFNADHLMLPIAYDPGVEHQNLSDEKSDIEELLEYIAGKSTLLNLPEHDPKGWEYRRRNLTKGQISQLNYYRNKLGLTGV